MRIDCLSESGVKRLAQDLFNDDGSKATDEARGLVKKYKNGAGMVEIMREIREAKARMAARPTLRRKQQARIEGI